MRELAPPGLLLGKNVYQEDAECFSLFGPEARISVDEDCVFFSKATIHAYGHGNILIGKRCFLGANARIYSRDRIEFGEHVLTSWDLTIFDYEPHPTDAALRAKQLDYMFSHLNPYCAGKSGLTQDEIGFFDTYWDDDSLFDHAPVRIGSNCWIGYGVSIMKGVTIGSNTIVAAKSVVTKSLPSNCVAGGTPARVLREL